MNQKWNLTEEQNIGPISRVCEFFIEELDCPDKFIYDLMGAIRDH